MIVTFVPYRGATWRITGVASSSASQRYLGRTLATARSFRPLGAEERRSIQAQRLRLATAHGGEDLQALARRTGNAWNPAWTAVSNGVFVNHRFEGGELVKVARVETYVPGSPGPR